MQIGAGTAGSHLLGPYGKRTFTHLSHSERQRKI